MKTTGAAKRKIGVGWVMAFLLAFRIYPGSPYFLWRFERDFVALPYPEQSKFVENGRAVASYGNGKECEFSGAQLRSYSGDASAIRRFYRSTLVDVPYDSNGDFHLFKTGEQSVEIEFLPSPLPAKYHASYGVHAAWDLSRWVGRSNLYLVLG